MTLIEAAKQALEALDCIYSPLHVREINKVGKARLDLRPAIEQAEITAVELNALVDLAMEDDDE